MVTHFLTFEVSSGAICFGPLQDIERAAQISIQPPSSPPLRSGGTIYYHDLEHNVQAENGSWHAYRLFHTEKPDIAVAWFAAHELVDPLVELRKLVRVAGSPYEYEHGHKFNCDATRAERVVVVNRYDWDRPREDEFATLDIQDILDEEGDDFMPNRNTVGLVDYAQAAAQVRTWSRSSSSQRSATRHGVWMHLPWPEYMFVRLGINDQFTHA